MSVINYERLSQTQDIRIVKTKRCIFKAMVSLLETQKFEDLTISDLCRVAMINRKTFYSHYNSLSDAFNDMQKYIINGYIAELKEKGIIFTKEFSPALFIKTTSDLINENVTSFNALYPYIRRGEFIRELALAVGVEVSAYVSTLKEIVNVKTYIFAFVFSLTGLLVSYFDWIDSEEPCSIEQLFDTVDDVFSHPLKNTLKTK